MEDKPDRSISITVSEETKALIQRISTEPALFLAINADPLRVSPLFYTEADPCFKSADGTNERRVVLKPTEYLREFVAAYAS